MFRAFNNSAQTCNNNSAQTIPTVSIYSASKEAILTTNIRRLPSGPTSPNVSYFYTPTEHVAATPTYSAQTKLTTPIYFAATEPIGKVKSPTINNSPTKMSIIFTSVVSDVFCCTELPFPSNTPAPEIASLYDMAGINNNEQNSLSFELIFCILIGCLMGGILFCVCTYCYFGCILNESNLFIKNNGILSIKNNNSKRDTNDIIILSASVNNKMRIQTMSDDNDSSAIHIDINNDISPTTSPSNCKYSSPYSE